LNAAHAKLATEVKLRAHAEDLLARVRNNVDFIDKALPAMLAYVDCDERVRYHNRAFTRWIGLEDKAIDGKSTEDLVGRAAYGEIGQQLKEALQGKDIRYERTQVMPNGKACRLYVQYLPHYSEAGKVAGVFAILTDITRAADLVAEPVVEEKVELDEGARLISALERDEFTLYYQSIAPLGANAEQGTFCEVLLRMNEEEENHLPPGSFWPLAEELGLLHEIDRWVVGHVLEFAAAVRRTGDAAYFVNLSAATIADPTFAQFVRERLKASRVPDHTLCFEIPEADALGNIGAYREFIAALDGTGCRFAVSGFGCNPLALRLLKQLRVDFLKLDGGIVLNMLSSPNGLAKVNAINLAAHAAGMRTVAQCVETDSTREALEGIDTDFAQGFGIARPRPMSWLADDLAREPSLALEEAAA
jgi:PAS domain S-box-containing protein